MPRDEPLSTSPLPPDLAPETASPPDSNAGPLSAEHLRQVAEANQRAKKLRWAAHVAGFNGWSLAVFATLSLPFALFSITGLVVTAGLAFTAWHEFRGRRLLRAFNTAAPRVLGWNQLALLALLVGYSVWSIYQSYTQPTLAEKYPELAGLSLDLDSLQRTITLAVYGGLILGTLLFQGINAFYYFSLAHHLREHLAQTEDWVVELQRTAHT